MPAPRRASADFAFARVRAKGRTFPVVVVGDLDTTPWSHELEDLQSRCRLQDSLVGCGLQPTWPFHNVFTSLVRIPLDHRPLFVRLAVAD